MSKNISWPRAYVYERKGWMWIHQSVPYKLRPLIGRSSYQCTLRTKDKAKADSKLEMYQKNFDEQFHKAEVRLAYLKLEMPVEEKLLEVANDV